ncbi:hypothetical protein GGR51DRAFT_544581 [Nemania sp. FL0031]|nr:hypothetical protein GGR51DRAFT_544581 [Nemania sp. FL0031]
MGPVPRRSTRANKDTEAPKFVQSWQSEVKLAEDWSPAQIDFSEWHGRTKHPADYDDHFFRTTYDALYDAVVGFCDSWFGRIHLDDWRDRDEDVSPWEVPMTDQFIQYARMVAHEDRGYVSWKDILNDPEHRKWLCVGIFAQIIERRIFNQLLFGAGEPYQAELDRHDSRWLLSEGFGRKEGRRQIARASLGEGLIPDNFWDEVDDLAGQTVLIFQPLFMLMCLGTGQNPNRDGAVFWQQIHSILAMAGYFQVCMAVSPSVFHVLSASPGARFQWEEEAHADQELYNASKDFHKSHNDRWRVLAELSSKNENTKVTKLMEGLTDAAETALYLPLPPNEAEYRMMDHQRRRGGKVMYAVFPKLTRYKAENVGEVRAVMMDPATAEDLGGAGEGIRITILNRCKVVYYQGLVHSPADQEDGVPLESHLGEIAWERMGGGILPYFKHHWTADGTVASSLHWPLWPEKLDTFWLYWAFSILAFYVLRWRYGEPPAIEDRSVYATIIFRPFVYTLLDAVLYAVLRVSGFSFLAGRNVFWTTQFINISFLLFYQTLGLLKKNNIQPFGQIAMSLLWLDKLFLYQIPDAVVDLSALLRTESPVGIINRATQLLTAGNSTA